MLQVRDVMTRQVVTLSPEHTLREAMALLARYRVSGAPVVAGAKLVGVVSATDLIEFASALPPVSADERAPLEIPSVDEPGVLPDVLSTDEAEDEEREASWFQSRWRGEFAADERMVDPADSAWSALDEHLVEEVMTPYAVSLPPTVPLAAAADLMRRRRLHRVLVLDHGKIVGILSTTDIVAAVAEGRLARQRWVFDRAPSGRE